MKSDSIEKRISILRFVMIFGVVVLHTPDYVPITSIGPGAFDYFKAFFQNALFRCSVPMLTCISGFLLFRAGLDTHYSKLISKKSRTLVVPFMMFSVLLAVAVYLVQTRYSVRITYQLHPFNLQTMLDAAFGLTAFPLNYPLSFIRDLLVLIMIAPLLGWLVRHAQVIGLVIVALVFHMDMDGYLIIRSEMPLMFYLGGMAAINRWDLKSFDRYAGICLGVLVALCVAIVLFRIVNLTFLRVLSPFLIWPIASMITDSRFGDWMAGMSQYSYFIFLAHAPVLLISWASYKLFKASVPYEIYWVLAPVVTTALLVSLYKFCMNSLPNQFGWMIGAAVAPGKRKKVLQDIPVGSEVRQ